MTIKGWNLAWHSTLGSDLSCMAMWFFTQSSSQHNHQVQSRQWTRNATSWWMIRLSIWIPASTGLSFIKCNGRKNIKAQELFQIETNEHEQLDPNQDHSVAAEGNRSSPTYVPSIRVKSSIQWKQNCNSLLVVQYFDAKRDRIQ